MWTEESNRFGWTSHLAQPPGAPKTPAGAVPARETELAGLPPTWIGVGSLDLFVVEDLEYAVRLTAAGVTAEVLVVPGAYHGFHLQAPHAELSRQFTAAYVAAFRRGLGLPPEVRETSPLGR